MAIDLTPTAVTPAAPAAVEQLESPMPPARPFWRRGRRPDPRRDRSGERRRLRHLDALSARLAELHAIDDLLGRAIGVVERGWVQDAWFTVRTPTGQQAVTAYDLRLAVEGTIEGACLVGAVVEGGGGPDHFRSQLVQRSLDLVWHTLREEPDHPVRWCPAPSVRLMHVLEMTYWNDAPNRTRDEVLGLLRGSQRTAAVQAGLCRAERDAAEALVRA